MILLKNGFVINKYETSHSVEDVLTKKKNNFY